MFAVIINDSRDDNALAREAIRASSLLRCPTVTIGVDNDLEASGNLVDSIDATLGIGAILVNVAPRSGTAKKWENGSPFCYFHTEKTIVVSTVDGQTLSLVKKLGLAETVNLLDVNKVLQYILERDLISKDLAKDIANSQFRSFEFLPRVAHWLLRSGLAIPSEKFSLDSLSEPRGSIWLIDCFGNAKTTILPDEVGFKDGKIIKTKVGELRCQERLADVPDHEAALIIGSSGFGNKRFLEVVVQGSSAAERFALKSCDNLV